MIVWVYAARSSGIYFLDTSVLQIPFENESIRIYQQNDTYHFRFPKTWQAKPYDAMHKVFRLFQEDDQPITLSFCPFEEGYDMFQPYAVKGDFHIGSAIDDAFYLEDSRLGKHAIFVQREKHRMTIAQDAQVSQNGKPVTGTIAYGQEDIFRTYNVQFVIHDSFILLNRIANLYTSLPVYRAVMKQTFTNERKLSIVPRYRRIKLDKTITVKLEEPLPFSQKQFNPLIFMMGPAITMGAASLTVGIMNMQQALMQGRTLQQSMSMLILPAVMILSTLLWAPMQRLYEKCHEKRYARKRLEKYRAYLKKVEEDIRQEEKKYSAQCQASFLSPDCALEQLSYFIDQHHPRQADWMHILLGTGTVTFTVQLPCDFRFLHEDPLRKDVQDLQKRVSLYAPCPTVISLLENRLLYLFEQEHALSFFYNILLQVITYFEPSRCRIAFIAGHDWLQAHGELRFLPHVWCDGFRFLIAGEKDLRLLEKKMQMYPQIHFIIFSRRNFMPLDDKLSNYTIIYFALDEKPVMCDAEIRCQKGEGVWSDMHGMQSFTWKPLAFAFTRYLHILRRYHRINVEGAASVSFLQLYGIKDKPSLPMAFSGEERSVWIGRTNDHEPFLLDLSEYGYGPHGLIAGMTGSGKSELLQNIVIGLMLRYKPDEVQFVLIDFKGGGLSGSILRNRDTMAHIAATLSNLSTSEMERALWSLRREIARRQKAFQEGAVLHGAIVSDIHAYRRYQTMPDLIIIVDEFAQLKKERPEFLQELIALARVGRSLGLHLLLATQKPAGIVDEQIWSNCHFKICLKVQSAADSREVIETGEASGIQNPGEMYVLCDGHLYHVYGTYAGMPKERAKVSVSTLALNGTLLETRTEAVEDQTEAGFLLACIDERYGSGDMRPLWENLPERISFSHADRPAYGIGRIDAIREGTFPWLTIDKGNLWYMTPDHEWRHQFADLLMRCLDFDCPKETVLIQIGAKRMAQQHPWAVLEAEEEERFILLLKWIEKERTQTFWILFADAQILPDYPFLQDWFFQLLLRHGEHVHCIFGTDVSTALNHRMRSRFERRIALCSGQEAGALFERSVHRTCQDHDGLVLYQNEIYRCRFVMDIPQHSSACQSCLPPLPDIVCKEENEETVLLGIQMETLTKRYWPLNKKLALLTVYLDEKALFQPFLHLANSVYMTTESYRRLNRHEQRQYDAVLLGGEGYKDQFLFPIASRRPLRKKEAILIYGARQEVIHLVES